MTEQTENLVLEILRRMQGDLSIIKHKMSELEAGVAAVRQDIHGLRGDVLRQERALAMVETRVERIETRLDLRDA